MPYPNTPTETSVQAALVAAFGCLVRHGYDVRLVGPESRLVQRAMRCWVDGAVAEAARDQQKTSLAAE